MDARHASAWPLYELVFIDQFAQLLELTADSPQEVPHRDRLTVTSREKGRVHQRVADAASGKPEALGQEAEIYVLGKR